MDKLHIKKQVASKKKKQSSENKIRTVKKMRGGGPYVFNENIERFRNFVSNNFENESNNYSSIKQEILLKINNYYSKSQINQNYEYYIFYIYDTEDDRITSIGIIGDNYFTDNDFTDNDKIVINNKEYFYINYLLSRERKGGTSAIYHILNNLPTKYAGICLTSTESSIGFYKRLGFTKHEDLMILDKNPENIHKLKAKLPHPITTEFYSTYPDNQIT